MSDEIKKQLEFVEWLKVQGMYNPMYSANVMERMFCVYEVADKEIQRLKQDTDYVIKCPNCDSMFNKIYDYCPWCGNVKLKKYQTGKRAKP